MATNPPLVRVIEWNTQEVASPIGSRHLPGGSFAFKQIVASGCLVADSMNPATTSGTLIFEDTKFSGTSSHLESRVAAITFHVVGTQSFISNMRLYLQDDSALRGPSDCGLDPAFVQFATSGIWQPNSVLPSGDATKLPNTVPLSANVLQQDGNQALQGSLDPNSSQFVYLNLIYPFGGPLGTYGVCGSGLLRYELMYDYFNAF